MRRCCLFEEECSGEKRGQGKVTEIVRVLFPHASDIRTCRSLQKWKESSTRTSERENRKVFVLKVSTLHYQTSGVTVQIVNSTALKRECLCLLACMISPFSVNGQVLRIYRHKVFLA